MDLHLTGAQATDEERAAVDSQLGLPLSKGKDDPQQANGANVEPDSKSTRHLLLPTLHAIQNRIGWISPGALNYVALRLDVAPAEAHGVASFYGMFSWPQKEYRKPKAVRSCRLLVRSLLIRSSRTRERPERFV